MATSNISTVQNVLNRQVNVDTLCLSGNFDAVSKSRNRAMRPAASAVLRYVLISTHRGIVDAIDVSPVPCLWNLSVAKKGLVRLFGVNSGIFKVESIIPFGLRIPDSAAGFEHAAMLEHLKTPGGSFFAFATVWHAGGTAPASHHEHPVRPLQSVSDFLAEHWSSVGSLKTTSKVESGL